jgi:hypothetical protein
MPEPIALTTTPVVFFAASVRRFVRESAGPVSIAVTGSGVPSETFGFGPDSVTSIDPDELAAVVVSAAAGIADELSVATSIDPDDPDADAASLSSVSSGPLSSRVVNASDHDMKKRATMFSATSRR